jgi:hypothetical protein
MFEAGRLKHIELIPVTLDVARVALAHGADFTAICDWMEQRCAELGTRLERHADRLICAPQPLRNLTGGPPWRYRARFR